MQIHLNADLKPHHSFALSQRCQVLVEVTCLSDLIEVYTREEWLSLPKLILGKGSNVLFTEFFAGVVVINQLMGIKVQEENEAVFLHVMGGEDWPTLVEYSVEQGWGGMENLAHIPGCAGSAPIQNIGAYGVEFKDVCEYVDYLDLDTLRVVRLNAEECEFGYRDSLFKHHLYEKAIIVAVGLRLDKKWQPKLGYGPLQALDRGCSITQVFNLICSTRMAKLPDPSKIGNAGSFFKNPVISMEHYQELQQRYPDIVAYPTESSMKVAAGWLIDQCGLKGVQVGEAQVHPQQALVLTNLGAATVDDIVALANRVVKDVEQRFQIRLEHEVRVIGRTHEIKLGSVEEEKW